MDISTFFAPARTFPTLSDLVNVLVKNVFVLAGVLLFILLILGGLKFITSAGSGEEKEMVQAKSALTAAIIGFIIIFGAYWIVQIIGFISGVNIFAPGV